MQHSAVQSSTVEYTYNALHVWVHYTQSVWVHYTHSVWVHYTYSVWVHYTHRVWVHYTDSVWVHPPSNPGVKLWRLFGKPPGTTLAISSEKLTVHYSFGNVKIVMDKIVNMLP